MRKSNKYIYPFKIENFDKDDYKTLKDKFKQSFKFDNFVNIPDTNYRVSLSFIAEIDNILFFMFTKCRNENISVSNFRTKREKRHYLKDHIKCRTHSLVAFLKDCNILLVLYNRDSLGYVTPTLRKYFNLQLEKEFECKIITEERSEKEIKNILNQATHITFKKARKRWKTYEKEESGSSAEIIKKYSQTKEAVVKIQRISKMPSNQKHGLLEMFRKQKYDEIIIGGSNIGEIDILEPCLKSFICDVSVDEDGLANVEDFKKEIIRIKEENKKLFEEYQSSE